MEPAKSGETTTMAAWAAVRALPQSLEAAKRSIVPLSTRLSEGEYEPPSAHRERACRPRCPAAISAAQQPFNTRIGDTAESSLGGDARLTGGVAEINLVWHLAARNANWGF